MKPVSFNLIMASHTQRASNLIVMIVIFLIAGALSPLLLPIPFFIAACVEIVFEPIRCWRTLRYREGEAASLTVRIRGIFPSAPDIRPSQLASLVRQGRLTVDGEDGSRLRLVLSDVVRLKKLRDGYTVRASFCPSDFGLGEFDKIMGDLVHSTPVATAVQRINEEERNQRLRAPIDLPYPEKPDLAVTEKPAFLQPPKSKEGISDEKKDPTKTDV
ncbi:hypothetical protein MUK71_15090 [Arthrobacter zhangbolii]|uniref:Uncharacterized protein n=1 Tax=Arthrobacter zhangbolii TaxID=2886936 RepID=A0A9X1SAZ1_9MICC|nr:hypothetical protein [Arthrobacter zhangbolii]MCC3272249.1 hypothetical protein [Arthrobacter zhangbolii]UON91881.1 hypothetical protein MUK71_15090 [Arthrobacter zhangbolii]